MYLIAGPVLTLCCSLCPGLDYELLQPSAASKTDSKICRAVFCSSY